MANIILDANVISLLADKKTGKEFRQQQNYYHQATKSCQWHVTSGVSRELKQMKARRGKRRLYADCLKLMESNGTMELSNIPVDAVLSSPDVERAFKEHNKTVSDRQDVKTAACAIALGFTLVTHDEQLAKRAHRLEGLEIISWHLHPRKGEKTIRRGRGGNRLN